MLRLTFGKTDVHVKATSPLTTLLASTHRRHATQNASAERPRSNTHCVSIELDAPERSPEFALQRAQRDIAGEVASAQGRLALAAVVVERDGRALALMGTPAAGKSTIAAHLLARGWRLVTDDTAFVDRSGRTVYGHHGLMRFRSGAIPHLPVAFRGTLERSRWFVGEDGELQFYEVDPAAAFGAGVWSHEAVLDSVVVLDERADAGAVDTLAGGEAFSHFDGLSRLRSGAIGRDRAVRLTDRIEQWYDAFTGT